MDDITSHISNDTLHCRAHLLLEKELFKLGRTNLIDMEILVNDESIFDWKISFTNLQYIQDEVALYLKFTKDFNAEPPMVTFQDTQLFHPNVEPGTGILHSKYLNQWNAESSTISLILSLQEMITQPCVETIVNNQASELFINDPKLFYERLSHSLVTQVESSCPPATPVMILAPQNGDKHMVKQQQSAHFKQSYEDYHKSWRKLATTKTSQKHNPLLDYLNDLTSSHVGNDELEEEITRQLSQHNAMMYGQLKGSKDQLKSSKKELIKEIERKSPKKNVRISVPTSPIDDIDVDDIDVMAIEAKELLEWTQALSFQDDP